MYYVTKIYRDLPAAHRQPNHAGHCRLIHGHNWAFEITFRAEKKDDCDFVVDVGELGVVKDFLEEHFDHTLLLNQDDPEREYLERHLIEPMSPSFTFAKIIWVSSCSMEGLAQFVYENVMALLSKHFPDDVSDRKLVVEQVICWEDSKNKATYRE